MPFDIASIDDANQLLNDLYNFREKLLYELSRPEAMGNLEEQLYDRFVTKLAEVQGCIVAAREYREYRSGHK